MRIGTSKGAAGLLLFLASGSITTAAAEWSPPTLLRPPITLLNLQVEMSIALDPLQNAVAVWNANGIVEAAYQASGGPWSAAIDVSQPADYEDTYEPQAVVGPAGSRQGVAMVIWTSSKAIPDQPRVNAIKLAMRRSNGTWTTPLALVASTADGLDSPRLARDRVGNIVAVWRRTSGGLGAIQAATRPIGGTWSTPVTVSSPGMDASLPQLAVSPVGEAVAVWVVSDGPGNPLFVQATSKSLNGGWTTPVDISTPTPQTWSPRVAIDGTGQAVAVWNQGGVITSAVRQAGDTWESPTALSEPGSTSYSAPAVAMDRGGKALVAWSEYAGLATMHLAIRPSGGAWSPPRPVSEANEDVGDPRVAVANSLMVVAWVDNSTNSARAAVFSGSTWASAPVTLGGGIWSSTVEVASTLGLQTRALWGMPSPWPAEAWSPVVSSYVR